MNMLRSAFLRSRLLQLDLPRNRSGRHLISLVRRGRYPRW